MIESRPFLPGIFASSYALGINICCLFEMSVPIMLNKQGLIVVFNFIFHG